MHTYHPPLHGHALGARHPTARRERGAVGSVQLVVVVPLLMGFFLAGQWSYDLRTFAAKFPPELGATVSAVAHLVPNLPLFNMRTLAAAGETTSPLHLALATLYAAVYVGCALGLAAAAFESKDFK